MRRKNIPEPLSSVERREDGNCKHPQKMEKKNLVTGALLNQPPILTHSPFEGFELISGLEGQ